ncbi:MAG: ChbG/HpnK family deacetylase [Ardenticatenaceae bacterium]|nr:ChbG/HpnK family deacetylase [Ardenticatenaceae bacterium]
MSLQLIVNADDYARSANVSRGIREAYRRGVVRSTSCMMNFPNAEADILLAQQETPELGMGVHLVLTSGYPLTSPKKTPTLVTEAFGFPNAEQFRQRLASIETAEAKQEWRAQIEKFVRITGQMPTHLDSHHHTSYYTKELFTAMLELAQEFGCAIRQVNAQDSNFLRGLPIEVEGDIQEFAPRLIEQFGIPTVDAFFASFYDTHATVDELTDILAGLPENGIFELMSHPGYSDAALEATTIYNRQRENELAVLTSGEVWAKIAARQIELVSYAALGGKRP